MTVLNPPCKLQLSTPEIPDYSSLYVWFHAECGRDTGR